MRILIAEDEVTIARALKVMLEKNKYAVDMVHNGNDALDYIQATTYDALVLDIMMPGMDGFLLCSKIRKLVDCPILFLTAKTEENSLVNGLALGADDYIHKPFGVMELRARVLAHLRREHREHSVRMALGRSCFNLSLKQMFVDEQEITLTKAEYQICEFLAKNRGQVFSKEQILEQVFGFDSESNDSTIITHIKNIRMKLSDYDYMPIKTVWGIGYRWEE